MRPTLCCCYSHILYAGFLALLVLSLPRSVHASCLTSSLRLPINVEHGCDATVEDGNNCALPHDPFCDWDISDTLVVSSFECISGSWHWTMPPVFCPRWEPICTWSADSLHCDGRNVVNPLEESLSPGSLDPDLIAVTFVNFANLEVGIRAFRGMSRLRELNLSSNNLTYLHPNSIVVLYDLEVMDLSNNRLTQVDEYTFPPSGSMTHINLRGNGPDMHIAPDFTFRAALEFCRDARDEDMTPNGVAAPHRTLLVDHDACAMRSVIVEQAPSKRLYCERVVCADARVGTNLSCSAEAKTYPVSKVCDGVRDCGNGEDENALCDTMAIAATSIGASNDVCDSFHELLNTSLLARNGLVIMPLAEPQSESGISLRLIEESMIMWRYEDLSHASLLSSNRTTHSFILETTSQLNRTDDATVLLLDIGVVFRDSGQYLPCAFRLVLSPIPEQTGSTTTSPASSAGSSNLRVIAGGGVAAAVVLVGVLLGVMLWRQRRQTSRLLNALGNVFIKTPPATLAAVRLQWSIRGRKKEKGTEWLTVGE